MSAQEEATMNILYEASMSGCVSTLNTLIQQNPLILNKISLTTFSETPLHVSALLGHLDFTKTILTHKPKLAKELDSCRRTPLHLASAEGHKQIVQILLQVYDDACLVHDQDGRIPVHYATIRGRTEVVRELIKAKPDSLRVLDKGNTLMHLCVTYNHLETLKVMVQEEGDTSEFLNFKNFDGRNTILHLATMLKQVERWQFTKISPLSNQIAQTVGYLLSIPKIIEVANNQNDMGFTALDILEHTPKDFKSFEIQLMLTEIGIKSKKNIQKDNNNSLPPPSTTIDVVPEMSPPKENYWNKVKKWMRNFLKYESIDWMEERRATLGLVSTVISTMSFQVAINPPGSIYQEINEKWKEQQSLCTMYDIVGNNGALICPGEAVLGIEKGNAYLDFLLLNSVSFVASLSVTILLVTGFPTKNKVVMWILIIGMCITISSLCWAYLIGILLTTPAPILSEFKKSWAHASYIFNVVFWFVVLFHIIHFLVWLVRKCKNGIKRMKSRTPRNREISHNPLQ